MSDSVHDRLRQAPEAKQVGSDLRVGRSNDADLGLMQRNAFLHSDLHRFRQIARILVSKQPVTDVVQQPREQCLVRHLRIRGERMGAGRGRV